MFPIVDSYQPSLIATVNTTKHLAFVDTQCSPFKTTIGAAVWKSHFATIFQADFSTDKTTVVAADHSAVWASLCPTERKAFHTSDSSAIVISFVATVGTTGIEAHNPTVRAAQRQSILPAIDTAQYAAIIETIQATELSADEPTD